MRPRAAIVTVGSELVEGLRVDTNTAEVAHALTARGFWVAETVSVGDVMSVIADTLRRLADENALVVVTGGLGPTHDDITREAAAQALGATLTRDSALENHLRPVLSRHTDPQAAAQVLRQADVLEGADVIMPTTGTAPGLIISTGSCILSLLPGPPTEMRPMLAALLARFPEQKMFPIDLGVTGLGESDAQVRALRALEPFPGVRLTVLARPGDVHVILVDEGGGAARLRRAADAVASELDDHVYSIDGDTLAGAVVAAARASKVHIALAESCTGGMVSQALTSVPGASDVFLGGVVAYDNEVKIELLDVPPGLLAQYGAVSEETAKAMAEGARARLHADVALSVTGIAGPTGGSADKPVGLVWFGVADRSKTYAVARRFAPTGRLAIRDRAVTVALDLLRREIVGL
ncbi:MAG: nicotinamide-nucleotide amidohydrolase family protein [Coriobacteriia bacterium]|nr:nicotinamide-nucleotide amidohydrolase family protein [Coriobacteriia bacterium]